jgi:hypothetical protein
LSRLAAELSRVGVAWLSLEDPGVSKPAVGVLGCLKMDGDSGASLVDLVCERLVCVGSRSSAFTSPVSSRFLISSCSRANLSLSFSLNAFNLLRAMCCLNSSSVTSGIEKWTYKSFRIKWIK